MKRSQDSLPPNSPQTSPFPAQKKQKVSPSTSEGLSTHSTEEDDNQGWTKVEKRAAKKLKKTENKHNVCVRLFKLSRTFPQTLQANLPRFHYNKGEITKRREAIGIDVSNALRLRVAPL